MSELFSSNNAKRPWSPLSSTPLDCKSLLCYTSRCSEVYKAAIDTTEVEAEMLESELDLTRMKLNAELEKPINM